MKLFVIKNENDLKEINKTKDDNVLLFIYQDIIFNEKFDPIDANEKNVIIFGNGKSFKNIVIDNAYKSYNGIFSHVKNLNVRDINIINANISSYEVCGVLAGKVDERLKAKNVNIDANIVAHSIVGSIAGIAGDSNVSSCKINGLYIAKGIIGGLVGMSKSFSGINNDTSNFNFYTSLVYGNSNIHDDVGYLNTRDEKHILLKLKSNI